MAVTQNDELLVTQLMDLGASLATQDLQGKTPLMTACEYGHLQALEALATRGVNMTGEEHWGGREDGGRYTHWIATLLRKMYNYMYIVCFG